MTLLTSFVTAGARRADDARPEGGGGVMADTAMIRESHEAKAATRPGGKNFKDLQGVLNRFGNRVFFFGDHAQRLPSGRELSRRLARPPQNDLQGVDGKRGKSIERALLASRIFSVAGIEGIPE